uniref:RNA-directed DNA polymerase, eukaryota, reverse transcriptase zinc-binding domain protein n=1 Tax=Tanacetum cinerariifolium TaxID=118510 RepID=A0A6L2N503_TANCI|nr:RNA-directed DNA polymerase, eukaryota, reverse transcriptase zinc-binding domain protein [Tanacetum cinerariifolium]
MQHHHQPPLNSPPLPPTTKASTTRPSSPHPVATAAYTTTSHHLHRQLLHHQPNGAFVSMFKQPQRGRLVSSLTADKGAFVLWAAAPKGAFVCCVFQSIRLSLDLGSNTPKLGNGVNTSFWDVAWCGDIAFKNLVPKLYALESMKNIEVASKLSHGGLEFSFRRNPRGGVEQAQFERLKEMAEGVTLSNSNDIWSWSLVGSGDFSVSSVRKLIDNAILPKGISKTRWIKEVPIKINVHAWKWDLEYREINSFEDWCQWISSIRLPVKQKHVFEGICYIVWWYTWNWRNIKIFGQEDPSMVNVYDEVVYRYFYWIRFRCKAKFSFIDWLKNPNLVLL